MGRAGAAAGSDANKATVGLIRTLHRQCFPNHLVVMMRVI